MIISFLILNKSVTKVAQGNGMKDNKTQAKRRLSLIFSLFTIYKYVIKSLDSLILIKLRFSTYLNCLVNFVEDLKRILKGTLGLVFKLEINSLFKIISQYPATRVKSPTAQTA